MIAKKHEIHSSIHPFPTFSHDFDFFAIDHRRQLKPSFRFLVSVKF